MYQDAGKARTAEDSSLGDSSLGGAEAPRPQKPKKDGMIREKRLGIVGGCMLCLRQIPGAQDGFQEASDNSRV